MAGARKKPNKKGGNYQGYFVDYTGKRVWFVGTSDRRATIDIAKAKEREHREVRLGYRPPPTAPVKHRARPFPDAVGEYIAWGRVCGRKDGSGWTPEHAKRKADYLEKWQQTLHIETLGDLDGDILPEVEAALRQMADEGFSGLTVTHRVDALATFCNWALKRKYLTRNPLADLAPTDSAPESERRALTPDEIRKLFSVVPPWRRLVYAVALVTGLRKKELRALSIFDLDVNTCQLRLRPRTTKNRKGGCLYLPRQLAAQLQSFAESGEPMERYRKARTRCALPESPLLFLPSHMLRILNKDLESAGIPKLAGGQRFDFHALRVSAVTLAGECGATMKELQTVARHADPKLTLNIYSRFRDSRMAELAEKVGQALPGVESATGVQFEAVCASLPERNPLPDSDLRQDGKSRGLCPANTGPVGYRRQ